MGPNRPVLSAAVLPSPVGAASPGPIAVKLTRLAPVTRGTPLAFRHRDRHLYLARQSGEVVSIRPDGRVSAPILDLRRDLGSHREQGLLGLVFSPDGHRMYVYYTSAAGEDTLERTLFVLPKPTHNAGQLYVVSQARGVLRIDPR